MNTIAYKHHSSKIPSLSHTAASSKTSRSRHRAAGFTIVELLIVIVIIGILAAIAIVAYNGIQNRAKASSLTSDLNSASKQLKIDQTNTGAYPATLAAANVGKGIPASAGTTYAYTVNNNSTPTSPPTFCLTATNGTTSFNISSNTQPGPGPCPVGWWLLNSDANDSSGNGNNGTVSGATPTTGQDGGGGTAYNFTSGNIVIPDSSSLDISGASTISLWEKLNNYGTYYAFQPIRKYSGTTDDANYLLYLFGNYQNNGAQGVIRFYGTAGGVWTNISNDYRINTGQWYHVVMSYNPAVGGQLFINGQPIAGKGSSGALATNNQPIDLAGDNAIDDVRIYNTALSPEDIKAIYDSGAK